LEEFIYIPVTLLFDIFLAYKIFIYNTKYEKCIGTCIEWDFVVNTNKTTFEYFYNNNKYVKTINFTSLFIRPKVGREYRIYVKKDDPDVIISSFTYKSYIYLIIVTILIYIDYI